MTNRKLHITRDAVRAFKRANPGLRLPDCPITVEVTESGAVAGVEAKAEVPSNDLGLLVTTVLAGQSSQLQS